MDAYLDALLAPELPLPWWLALVLWIALYASAHVVAARAHARLRAQSRLVLERPEVYERMQRPAGIALAFVLLTAILLAGYPMGEPYTTLISGGLLGTMAMMLGLGLRSLAFAASLVGAGVDGELRVSPAFALVNAGHGALAGAAALLVAGIALAQLALVGAALFLGGVGLGYVDRARKLSA